MATASSRKKDRHVRKLCEKGKFKALLAAVTGEELRQDFRSDLTQPIHYFAARGNLEAVRTLTETHKCNPECQNVHGITPMHCASYCGRLQVVKYLAIQQKCDVNVEDKEGACPLAYAAFCVMGNTTLKCPLDAFQSSVKPRFQHIQTAKLLLSPSVLFQTSLSRPDLCIKLLRLSVYCGSFADFVHLESLLNPKLKDNSSMLCSEVSKCLEIALEQNKWDFAESLLCNYVSYIRVAVNRDQEQSSMSSPFHIACAKANIDLIKKIVEHGICKPDVVSLKVAIDRKKYDLIQFLLESADHPLVLDRFEGWSSLLSYILENLEYDQKLFMLVVGTTIGADFKDSDGNTPLHLLCKDEVSFIPEEYSCYQHVLNNKHQLPIHIACHESNLQAIKFVSSQLQFSMINTKDVDGNTPLHIVCNTYDVCSIIECLKYLVNERKCDVSVQNNNGELPVHIILKRRRWPWLENSKEKTEIIQILTSDQCCKINAQDSTGNTPLHIACENGDSNTILYLVSNFNCNLNVINDKGCIPLHYALSSYYTVSLEVVLAVSNGCTLKYKQNNLGKTPLHIGCEKLTYNSMNNEKKILLDSISDSDSVNAQDSDGNTPLHIACKQLLHYREDSLNTISYLTSNFECNLDLLNADHCLPLHYALSSYSSLELLKVLSKGCTLMHMQNKNGMTPLHMACSNNYYNSCSITVRYLVFEKQCFPSGFERSSDIYDSLEIHLACKHKNDIDLLKALANEQNVNNKLVKNYGRGVITPAYVACEHGNHLALQRLLELKCDIQSKDSRGRLPFHVACSKSLECVKLLSPYVADDVVNTGDKFGNTPLHMAFQNSLIDIVEYLLSTFRCNTSLKNDKGELPLHMACITNVTIVRLVVKNSMLDSTLMDCQTKCGETPLHMACKAGALDIVKYFTESFDCNAIMTLRDDKGKSPVDYACEHSLELVKLVSQSCTTSDLVSRHHKSEKYIEKQSCFRQTMTYRHNATTLDMACMGGSLEVVKYLINDKGCCLSELGNDHSALGYACGLLPDSKPHSPSDSYDIVQFLIGDCGYNPCEFIQNKSSFEYACQKNSLDLMKALTGQQFNHRDKKGNTPLHYACQYECIDIVMYLIEHGCNQNTANNEQELPLHIACRKSLELTKLLNNCDINSQNDTGDTPLHIACQFKKQDIMLYLIEEMKCDVRITNADGKNALHIASSKSMKVRLLVQRSDINCQDYSGNTPLHDACYHQNYDMIQLLLSFTDCRTDISNKEGQLVFHVLLKHHSFGYNTQNLEECLPVIELILQRNCNTAIAANNDGVTPLDIAVERGMLQVLARIYNVVEIEDRTSSRLLHTACEHGRSEIVRWLIDHGASTGVRDSDMNFPQHRCFYRKYNSCLIQTLKQLGPVNVCKVNKNNDTILHLACKKGDKNVLFYLLNTFDDCKKAFSIQNDDKETPLHMFASKGIASSEILKLIECENPNIRDESGNTPLHLACRHKNVQFVHHLVTNCMCNLNIVNNQYELPIHIALARLDLKTIQLVISHENVDKCTKDDDTPLHIACRVGNLDASKLLLLDYHCNPNTTNSQGDTPLHIAAEKSLELVKLVATPENMNVQNANGDTPLHLACRGQTCDIMLYLLKEHKCLVNILNLNSESAFHVFFSNWKYTEYHLYCCVTIRGLAEKLKPVLSYIPKSLRDIANKTGDTLLHVACINCDYLVVELLVKYFRCNIDINNKFSGATPLHFACYRGSLKMVALLSRCNPTSQITDTSYLPKYIEIVSGDTPLHVACRKGDVKIISHLLKTGHSIALNCPNSLKELPIHLAICNKLSVQIIKLFISHKTHFDCNAKMDVSGYTPLHIICRNNPFSDCLRLLVNRLKCKVDQEDYEGNLPLHIVCQNERICKSAINILSKNLSDHHMMHQNKKGNTALHELFGCEHTNYNIEHFQSLLLIFVRRNMFPTDRIDNQVLEYIHLAFRHQRLYIIKCLLEMYTSRFQEIPQSVLYEACLNCNGGVLKYVLNTFEHTFDVNQTNKNGDLPLHLATRMKVCAESTILLISKTENINCKNLQSSTPLHELYSRDESSSSSYSKSTVLAAFLVSEVIDLNAMSADGFTPLHCICLAGEFEDLCMVIEKKEIDPNIPDKEGMTLLHHVCRANNLKAVRLILSCEKTDPSIEDSLGRAPISITTDSDIVRLLTEYGANPKPLYVMHKAFFERFSSEKPPPTPVKLLVIGHPSVGKTTLIQSLQNELLDEVISQNFDHTAGIVTTNFCSQLYGDVTFYDFAGQAEYYASHDAIIHSTIKNVPPIVLILVNLIQSTPEILDQTYYWINFISNRCSSLSNQPAHMIIIGSHADILESRKKDPSEKASRLRQSVASQLEKKNVVLKGIIPLNCTRAQSNEMTMLHELLQQSTDDLRDKGVMNFNSHCFFVLLLQMFRNNNVVNLGYVLRTLKSESKDSKNSPLFALPSDRPKVIEMCYDLNEKGHIMFIEDPLVIDMSWLILEKAPLLTEILGTLFAPSNFPQHCPLSYSTGVVPLSRFDNHFRTKLSYPSSLSLTFLSRLEYCREIKDRLVLKSIVAEKEFSESERYYFFPNLVSLERPNDIWSDDFSYKCGWLIQCIREPDGESFNPHFIQALLLRLAFSFTPKKTAGDSKSLDAYEDNSDSESDLEEESQIKVVVIERLCSVWKNGIYWLEHSGIKTVVELINPSTLVLLMQCVQPGCEMQLIKRRSCIISMVLNARDEFCGKAELREYFLHPSIVKHPLPSLKGIQKRLFSFQQVKKSIVERNPCVINDQNEHVHLEDLLYFEPYSDLCKDVKTAKFLSTSHNEQFSIFQGRKLPQGTIIIIILLLFF